MWRANDISRTRSTIALPLFRVTVNEKSLRWTQMPSDVWKMELEKYTKDKVFRGNLSTEFIMSFLYMDRWMLSLWNCAHLRRDLLIFEEV